MNKIFYFVWLMIGLALMPSCKRANLMEQEAMRQDSINAALQDSINTANAEKDSLMQLMGDIADGFELGHERYGSIFNRTGEEEADAYLQAMKEELEPLSLAMAEGIDATPVIRPVIDMSNIEEGMQWMHGAFGRGYGVSLNGNMPALVGRGNVPVAAAVNPNQNGSSINRIVDSINSRLDRMQDAMEHWEMVLDSGELVGGIVDKMDKSLGVRAAKARRRG